MKDYQISSHLVSSSSSIFASSVLQQCPIDSHKYFFHHYSQSPSTIYSCVVNTDKVVKEPYNYNQAVHDQRWVDVMSKELQALEFNNTCTVIPLPSGKKVIGCRWVYKVKYLSIGDIDKFKVRLVVEGYTQTEGEDYHSTFAPVA